MGWASKPVAFGFAILTWIATTAGIVVVAGDGTSGASGPNVVQRGPVSLQYSAPWHRAPVVDSRPFGMELAMPVQLREAYANLWTGRIVAGAPVPGELPPGFASNVHGPPSRQKVQLHGVPAMAYSGVVDPGASRFTLYVVATDKDDYAVLCVGATWSDARRCEKIMQTTRLENVSAIPPGVDASLSQRLERLVDPLKEQSDLVSDLAAANSISGVARSAQSLHDFYRSTGRSLAELQARPRDRRAVVALANALVAEADGLKDLAESTRTHHDATYGASAVSVEASSRVVLSCLRRLRRDGFAGLPLLMPFSIPPLSALESVPAAPEELVHITGEESENPPPYEAEETQEGETWEEAQPVEAGPGKSGTGATSDQKGEPAEPVEGQGQR